MKAAIYTRLSQDRDGETSTERQEADCRAYAAARGWEVETVYRDKLSGYKDVVRPDYERFIDDLRTGAIDVGIIWKLDRLTRKGIKDIAPLLEALQLGGTALASVNDSIDTSTAMGEGVLGLLASIAKQESQNTSLRVRSAMGKIARDGKPNRSGCRPFGFRADYLSLEPVEAEAVREAVAAVLAGRVVYEIALDWQRRGIVSPLGNVMAASVVRNIIKHPRNAGLRLYQGEAYPAVWPAIVSREDWEAVTLRLASKGPHRRVRSYMLTGVALCGICGVALTPRVTGAADGRRRTYRCTRVPGRNRCCGRVMVSADAVEALVTSVMLAAMAEQELLVSPPAETGAALGPLLDEMKTLRDRLGVLEEAFYTEGTLEKGRFHSLRDELVDRLGAVEARCGELMALDGGIALAEALDPAAAWESWSLEERRKLVRAWFPRIEVDKTPAADSGKRFGPGRVRFVDRAGAGWRVSDGELRPEAAGDRRFLRLG